MRRVVITGLGCFLPCGDNIKNAWEGILKKECWIKENTKFDTKDCKSIILTGHMCILNANMEIEELPSSVFNGLEITHMVLLKNEPDTIKQNLMKRDNKNYSLKLIEDFQKAEEEAFLITVQNIGAKSKIIDLVYDNSDVARFQKFLEE